MSRRGLVPEWRKEQQVQQHAPLRVLWAEPETPRTPVGHCPRCGVFVGRAIRGHTKHCDGKRVE